jgi:hypothetical protein
MSLRTTIEEALDMPAMDRTAEQSAIATLHMLLNQSLSDPTGLTELDIPRVKVAWPHGPLGNAWGTRS